MKLSVLLTIGLTFAITVFSFQNCSKIDLKPVNEAGGPSVATDSSAGEIDPPPTTQTPENPKPSELPKYKMVISPCSAGETCTVFVQLDYATGSDFRLEWKTNDEIYKTDSKYAKPGYHYESTNGVVTIRAGERESKLQFKSIRWSTNDAVKVRIDEDLCQFGSQVVTCGQFKNEN